MAANTFANDIARAADPTFRSQIQAAIYKLAPAVIGEAATNPPTQAGVDKRHTWMTGAVTNPGFWVPIVSSLAAGQASIRSVDMPAAISDATVETVVTSLISDLAGLKNGE